MDALGIGLVRMGEESSPRAYRRLILIVTRLNAQHGWVKRSSLAKPRLPDQADKTKDEIWAAWHRYRWLLHHSVYLVVCSRCHRSYANGLCLVHPPGLKIDADRTHLRATSG